MNNKAKAALAAAALTTAIPFAPQAQAEPAVGCQTDYGFWFLKGTVRTICDGAIRPDGSWLRNREFYTPAHQVPMTTNCYGYRYITCTTYGGYWQQRMSNGIEDYIVFPYNVLPDEPGHLQNNGV
jgi:hypothetical protein